MVCTTTTPYVAVRWLLVEGDPATGSGVADLDLPPAAERRAEHDLAP